MGFALRQALYPPAAPYLNFASAVVGVADCIDNYRAAQTLAGWIDLKLFPVLAETIARQLAIAQEPNLTLDLTADAKGMIQVIQNKCALILERIKSGQVLNIQESRALLDANTLLSYMKSHNMPVNANLSQCVALLLNVIMGDGYVHAHPVIRGQQTSKVATTVRLAIVTTTQTHTITPEELREINDKTKVAERKAEEALQNAALLKKELETLRKEFAQSNPNISFESKNGNGTVTVQQKDQMVNTPYGEMPISAFLKIMLSKIAALEGGLGTTNYVLASLQEQQSNSINNDNISAIDQQQRQRLLQQSSFNYHQKKN